MRLAPGCLLRAVSAVLVFGILVPSAGAAASAPGLSVHGEAAVARGDFIRTAVQTLGVTIANNKRDLPYARVPGELLPFVQTAYEQGALAVFGRELALERNITRGEALQLLTKLAGVSPSAPLAKTFSDVKAGSPLATAVAVALEKSWMRPLRTRFFGADRVLRGREATLLLARVRRPVSQPIRVKLPPKLEAPKTDVLDAVWDLLQKEYLYQDRLDGTKAGSKAIQGLVDSLQDPYTTYLPPASAENYQTILKGELEGIGATVELTGGLIRIVSPLRGSPAEKAGLQPHDVIISVDGKGVDGLSLDEAVSKIRGPKGTTVHLKIRRSGTELDVAVVRDTIKIPEIEVTDEGNGVWVVRLIQFGQTTDQKLREQLADLQKRDVKGIVLDLRSNPGGLLHAAGVVMSNFVPNGTPFVSIHGRNETHEEVTQGEPTVGSYVKLAVLVNRGSASASEIVAGALQDAGRANIIGEKTFGKGTVQQLVEFSDGSSLKYTIAEWFTPKGRKIDGLGIEPDILVQEVKDHDAPLDRALGLVR